MENVNWDKYQKVIRKQQPVEKEASTKPMTWDVVCITTDTVVATVSYKDALATQPELDIDAVYDMFVEKLKAENIEYTSIRPDYENCCFDALRNDIVIDLF